jgi:NAD(P)-dependent dehydrogenase (short-subunit alcohol dehydrogenase family)
MLNQIDALPATKPLASFGEDLSVAVIGASGGIGGAFTAALQDALNVARVFTFSRRKAPAAAAQTTWQALDLEDEASIARAAATVKEEVGELHLAVVASGLLHAGDALQPEKSWRSLDAAALQRAFAVNAIGPALIAKHFLPLLARDRKSAFAALSARVGSIEDNRLGGWHAYRASKAALNMLLRNFAIELARRNDQALCVGLHPGTVDTALSEPFQAGVPEGKLFTPARAATQLLGVLDGLTPGDSGGLFAWDGQRIPF